MKLTVFASGSGGNCSLVQGGGKNILIDAGISAARMNGGLSRAGISPADLDGIFITHEHTDHIQGLSVFLKHTPVPVYAPGTAACVLRQSVPGADSWIREISPEAPVMLSPLVVLPFPTPHDTQSVGYRLESDHAAVSVATDTGRITDTMLRYLLGADIAFIEANHDEDMLRNGPYPASLKQRILSEQGHLSNAECTWLTAVLAQAGTRQIVIGHLSRKNNRPDLAQQTVCRGLEGTRAGLSVAPALGFLEVEAAPCFT